VFGARVVPVRDHWEISGAFYSFGESGRGIVKEVRQTLATLEATGGATAHSQRLISRGIIATWLTALTIPRLPPILVDRASQEPLMLVTDHYEVLDWSLLARRLGAEPDVDGDRKNGWTRFVAIDDETRRSLLAINIGRKKNRLECFAQTLRLADGGRAWLERVAGDSIRFLARDMVDPASVIANRGEPKRKRRRAERSSASLAPADLSRFHQDFAERHYHHWADEPIPALGDRTPREAAETEMGRESVVNLLKQYETAEFRRARKEQREPVDFAFLWEQVGLDRMRELAER
jgi:hypothetical protein